MIHLDLNKLLDEYIQNVRFNVDHNKLFGKTNNEYITDLTQRLGLTRTGDKTQNCIQIVRKLITDYKYFGDYTYGPVNAFLDIYSKAQRGNIIEYVKLQHLEHKVSTARQSVKTIMFAMNGGEKYYEATQSDINRFKNHKFIQQLAKECAAEEQRRKEEEDQRLLQEIEELRRKEEEEQRLQQQELDEQYRQFTIEQQQKMIAENNPVINEPLQNDFLANKEMTEPFPRVTFNDGVENLRRKSMARINDINHVNLQEYMTGLKNRQHTNQRTKKNKLGITGMDDLIRVVVNLKNDVKQIREAQSVESANTLCFSNLFNIIL